MCSESNYITMQTDVILTKLNMVRKELNVNFADTHEEILKLFMERIDEVASIFMLAPLTSSEHGIYSECIEACCNFLQFLLNFIATCKNEKLKNISQYTMEHMNAVTNHFCSVNYVC